MNQANIETTNPSGVKAWAPLLLIAAAAGLALALPDYRLFQATLVLGYAIALLGMNMLTGYNGQISLGHGAFFAIGAYAVAIGMSRWGISYWAMVPIAAALCFAAGYAFGLPALKLEGLYLALATFALGVALPQMLKNKHLESWTGGVQGIVLTKPEAPWGLPLSADQWLYLCAVAVTALMFLIARNILDSGAGRAIVAIREQPLAAEAMGIDNRHHKTVTFGISAMYCGVAGALSAIAVQFVGPDSFTTLLSISFLVGIVVGGVATVSGAFYGALFIMYVPGAAEQISKDAPWAIYGVVLILFVFVLPGGIAGLVASMGARRKSFGARGEPAVPVIPGDKP